MSFSRRRFFSENLGGTKGSTEIYIYIYISGLMGRLEVAGNGIRQRPAGSLWWRRVVAQVLPRWISTNSFPVRFCFNIFPHRAVIDPHHSLNWTFDSLPPINRINRLFFFYSIGFVESTRKCIPFFFFSFLFCGIG